MNWHWYDRITVNVILGAIPFKSDVAALYGSVYHIDVITDKENVRAVLSLCAEKSGRRDDFIKLGCAYHAIPVTDFTVPVRVVCMMS